MLINISFSTDCQKITFFESCGMADLVATCYGGRNNTLGEAVVKSDKVNIFTLKYASRM